MKKSIIWIFLCVLSAWSATSALAENGAVSGIPTVPTEGMVTMVDLGAHKCIPCKMMAPILAELEKEYAGRASIIFIDVWEHKDQARRFGIQSIPTQIFYDASGKEIYRHVGFMDKKQIVEILEKLGAY